MKNIHTYIRRYVDMIKNIGYPTQILLISNITDMAILAPILILILILVHL